MRHFHRTHIPPDEVIALADTFFLRLGLQASDASPRARTFAGPLGTMRVTVRMEGGHYTLVEVVTDQVGESRLDKNVKRFFVQVHRRAEPTHAIQASF